MTTERSSAPSSPSEIDATSVMSEMWHSLMLDRKAQRRAMFVKYGLLTSVALVYVGAFLGAQLMGKSEDTSDKPYATLVRVQGEIGPSAPASADVLVPLLERAFKDKDAKGVVLLINSPGGTPVQSALIHDRIVQLKRQYNKKVIAVGEDLMASGAYMVAVAADEIVVNRSTVAGSIGVVSRGFGFTGLMEKLGVERRVATAGTAKNLLDPFSPQTERDEVKQREMLSSIHTHFIDTVKEGRGAKLQAADADLFTGTVWTGERAKELGLVDTLGDVRSATASLNAEVVQELKPPRSLMDVVLNGVSTRVMMAISAPTQAPVLLTP